MPIDPRNVDSRYVIEEEFSEEQAADSTNRWLVVGIFGVVILLLTFLLYGLIAGVLNPPAPRTAVEFAMQRAEATIQAKPESGRDWADYALLLYKTGDKAKAKATIKKARKVLKNNSLVYVNNAEIEILLREGKNAEALKAADAELKYDAEERKKLDIERAKRGVKMPVEYQREMNKVTIDTLVMKARAQSALKKYDDAITSLAYAIYADPQAADVIVMRGELFLKVGNKEAAKNHFVEALKFIPDYEPALNGLKRLGVDPSTLPSSSPGL